MTASNTDNIQADDLPDECPKCGTDLTVDRETESEMLHAARKAFYLERHMRNEHPWTWKLSKAITWVLSKFK